MRYETNWKPTSVNSMMISWSYGSDGTGVVILGVKDPMGIEQRTEIFNAFSDEEGLAILKALGVDPVNEKLV